MKTIRKINLYLIGLTFTLITLGWIFKNVLIYYGLLLTIPTGIYQVAIVIKLMFENPTSKLLKLYLISVIMLFIIYFIMSTTRNYNSNLIKLLFLVPPILAIYFTYIINQYSKK